MDELHHECGIAAIYHLPGAGLARWPRSRDRNRSPA